MELREQGNVIKGTTIEDDNKKITAQEESGGAVVITFLFCILIFVGGCCCYKLRQKRALRSEEKRQALVGDMASPNVHLNESFNEVAEPVDSGELKF